MLRDRTNLAKFAHILLIGIFAFFASFWVLNQLLFSPEHSINALYSDSYWIIAVLSGGMGLYAAKKWGGLKSVFGRSIFLFSLGLIFQVFGQLVYTYYARIQHVEVPYPSLGDIGYFGSVLLYIGAIYLLAKTAGASLVSINITRIQKMLAFILPAIMLVGSYMVLLRDYQIDWSQPLIVFLDFGYPLGQAIYVSLALLTYILSRGLLGGIMKNKILLLLTALFIQYCADYVFLFKISRGTWLAGGLSDLLYLLGYFVMGLALFQFAEIALLFKYNSNAVDQATTPSGDQQGAI